MKQEVIDKLVEIEFFNKTSVSEEEYNKYYKIDDGIMYYKSEYKWSNGNVEKYFWKTDTRDLTPEEIDLLLKIKQTQDIGTIKKASIFFVTLSVISIVISIIGAVNIASIF